MASLRAVDDSPVLQWGVMMAAMMLPSATPMILLYRTPLSFLMTRWRSGYGASFALATRHALYCIGCCGHLTTHLYATFETSVAANVSSAAPDGRSRELAPHTFYSIARS